MLEIWKDSGSDLGEEGLQCMQPVLQYIATELNVDDCH